ncbi:histidine phosphotransferase family protein [Candidatus Anaplasma sp. TIGMIC]|uniref:histidine phosphotransferase family protein n=1 Tax=Candidatus Anaplasma sp. TIGMIC TaxID=3020713 RepID=UPI00232DE462|nr:histidine phosphotransferase family protein [Candidatus Anaplasma sp. TIGMIC]MDB1135765.1 histidine phosphotransferase family protein [Candidatus Anaplasma sp. TIGMIC]
MADGLASMEVFAARLLHDVAGSIGSVVSLVECFLEDPECDDMKGQLEEAVDGMISRFRLVRQAYCSSEDNSSFCSTQRHIEKYLKKRGLCLVEWNIAAQFADADMVERVNRLVIQAVLFSAMVMVQGTGLSVSVCRTDDTVHIQLKLCAAEVSVHRDVERMLSREEGCELTTHNVQAYFLTLLCKEYGATFRYSTESALVEVHLPAVA